MIASLLKCVSDFTADYFFCQKGAFWLNISTKKDTWIKILIIPVLNKILKNWDTLFELIQIELQCSKNHFRFFLSQENGPSANNIEKEPQKPRPKLEKYIYQIFIDNICSACNQMQVVVFYKHVLILLNSNSKFLTLKVA